MSVLVTNRRKQFLAPHVEGLIKHLTGFEEEDRNYQEVEKFVYSNFLNHNFASVDINKVQSSIDGIGLKFRIHSLTQRERRFRELVKKYLSSDFSHHSQLDVQWCILLLLLKLSKNPTSVSEEQLRAQGDVITPLEPQIEVDWSSYLKEGWEEFQHPDETSDEEELWLTSSEEDEVEPSCAFGQELLMVRAKPEYDHQLSLISNPPTYPSRHEALWRIIREATLSEQWIRGHLQDSWLSDGTHSKGSYAFAHTHYLKNDSMPVVHTNVVSEDKVIQEILWMLQVSSDTVLFSSNEQEQFRVNPNLAMPSTIPDTLMLVLEHLCCYFNMINSLKKFIKDVSEKEMSETPPPLTYKAYCAALSQQLDEFNCLVIRIETEFKNQGEMTLVSLITELTPGLNMLQYLYDIHTRAVMDWHTQAPWICTTRLLSVLYMALLEEVHQAYVKALLTIFIHTFHVYLDIIDVWLSEGRLEDWRNEFLVVRKGETLVVMPYEEEMKQFQIMPVSLLRNLVTLVRDAGHTMETVSQLNKLQELRETVHNKGCLFKEFAENIYNELNVVGKLNAMGRCSSEPPFLEVSSKAIDMVSEEVTDLTKSDLKVNRQFSNSSNSSNIPKLDLEKYLVVDHFKGSPKCLSPVADKDVDCEEVQVLLGNPLLAEALRVYLHTDEPSGNPCSSEPNKFSSFSGSMVGLMSINNVLEKQLELVATRHKIASRLVTQTLRDTYALQQHITVLQMVFFMKAGNLAQRFYSDLFREIEHGTLNNPLSLSVHLQMCVEEVYPGFGNYFSVIVSKGNTTHSVHLAIPTISLAYRVDWPVSSIITQDAIDSYNKVFRFLLHIKYSSWTLHNLRFSDLSGSPNYFRVRRLQVLKHWMNHSTNTLHAYFMRLVLRSFSKHLEESIKIAETIEFIIQAHNNFLDEVKSHCLQDKNTSVETFIMKLLRLCSTLAGCWENEAANMLAEEDLRKLEERYVMAYRGLVHCLEAVSEEGSSENILCELKSEIAHSVPEPCYVDY